MATQKHPTALAVVLKDGRTAKITSWDPETNEYFVKPDTLAEGQTRIRSTKFTEAELDKLLPSAPVATGFTPKANWPTTRTKATVILANGDTIEVMAFLDDGALSVDGHEHTLIGKDGCFLDDHEIRGVTFHTAPEVVTPTVVKPAPVAEKPKPAQTPAVVPQQKNEVMNPADLVDFQFVTGEAVDGPGFLDTPRLQLGQLVGKSVELGWKVGDIMFADMVLASAEGGDGRSPIGKRAGPIELAFLRGDSYWAEDIPFEVQKKQNLQAKIARTLAEKLQFESPHGWKACVDYTFLVRKPDSFADPLGLFTIPVGNTMWALALFSAREKSGSAGVINAIQTAVKLYLKGRPYAGKFTLGSEVVKNDLNTFAATKFNRVGVWDEATVAGIVEILRGFQQK